MAEQPPRDPLGHEPEHEAGSGAPRWVKGFVVALLALVLLVAVLHLTGNSLGDH